MSFKRCHNSIYLYSHRQMRSKLGFGLDFRFILCMKTAFACTHMKCFEGALHCKKIHIILCDIIQKLSNSVKAQYHFLNKKRNSSQSSK